jgi:CATRA-associated small protein
MPAPESQSTETEIISDARGVLSDMLEWELTPARWEQLSETIGIAVAAEQAHDLEALRRVTIELELAGPVRITRLGATPTVAAPPHVRERINLLIHELGRLPRDADDDPDPGAGAGS